MSIIRLGDFAAEFMAEATAACFFALPREGFSETVWCAAGEVSGIVRPLREGLPVAALIFLRGPAFIPNFSSAGRL